jgi:RecA-family ATPase
MRSAASHDSDGNGSQTQYHYHSLLTNQALIQKGYHHRKAREVLIERVYKAHGLGMTRGARAQYDLSKRLCR